MPVKLSRYWSCSMQNILRVALLWIGWAAMPAVCLADPFTFTSFDVPGSIAVPGGVTSEADGINSSGQIAGEFTDKNGVHGFLLSQGMFSTLDFPGATFTGPRGINDRGQIVGLYMAGGNTHGFLDSAGQFTTIDFPGADSTTVRGINDSGSIEGIYFSSGVRHSFLLKNGIFSTIDPPNSNSSAAFGINNLGDILIDTPAGGVFLFNNNVYTAVNLAGIGRGLNDLGEIVGNANDGINGFFDINGGFNLLGFPGAAFNDLHAVNNSRVIVGDYVDNAGVEHALIATPVPEPTTVVLFGSGLLILFGVRQTRRRLPGLPDSAGSRLADKNLY
jgi:uncharacterized membrane protein